jgi:hypothetical protein
MIGKEDKRQGITRNPTPTSVTLLFTARGYVSSLLQEPGKTEQQLVENGFKEVDNAIEKINTFFINEWPAYQKNIEVLNLSLFKEVEPLKE